jgi:hypothetical protein
MLIGLNHLVVPYVMWRPVSGQVLLHVLIVACALGAVPGTDRQYKANLPLSQGLGYLRVAWVFVAVGYTVHVLVLLNLVH